MYIRYQIYCQDEKEREELYWLIQNLWLKKKLESKSKIRISQALIQTLKEILESK